MWYTQQTTQNLLGRNGQPEDVAKLVSWLVSDEAAFVTGKLWASAFVCPRPLITCGLVAFFHRPISEFKWCGTMISN